jgi:signal transduction histidine kinase
MTNHDILLIEDNPGDAKFLQIMLNKVNERLGCAYNLISVDTLKSGLHQIQQHPYKLLFLDLSLPDSWGIDTLKAVREINNTIPVIVLTGLEDESAGLQAVQAGAQDYLVKGKFDIHFLARSIQYSIERASLLANVNEARSEAERANRAKDEFLAVLSHELRSPLTGIMGWAALLNKGMLDPSLTQQALESIGRLAKTQSHLIEDILDVSRIVAGKVSLNKKKINLKTVISSALEAVRPTAELKRITIDSDVAGVMVKGDKDRLQQVIWNILMNAIKFTPEGGHVSILLRAEADNAVLTVSDTGIGISKEFLPYVFDRFKQADSSSTRVKNGLGLGMAIVKHMVSLHEGTVCVESEGEGLGATFKVTIPRIAEHAIENADVSVQSDRLPSLHNLKILFVDDDINTLNLIQVLLSSCGAEVRTCSTVAEALEILTTWTPDVLISDICLPHEDGYSLIQQIRKERHSLNMNIPAIALTSLATKEDREKVFGSGFNEYIAKPAEITNIALTVANVVTRAKTMTNVLP